MTYIKQEFEKGQVLTAAQMNHIENGIGKIDEQGAALESQVAGFDGRISKIEGQVATVDQHVTTIGQDVDSLEGKVAILEGKVTESFGGTLASKYAGLVGKKISFLGDSITTFNGQNPSGYAVFYPRYGIDTVEKTWWKQFIDTCGLKLLVNAAWSGSTVSSKRNNSSSANTSSAAMGASDRRVADLSKDGQTPDIVICFIGTNDFADNVELGTWDGGELPADGVINTFSEAYAMMVSKVMKKYPQAEVFCCTILEATGAYNGQDDINPGTYPMAFTNSAGGMTTCHDYNNAIRRIAHAFGANVLDMHACGLNYFNASTYLGDTLHPNPEGAKMMARKALSEVSGKSVWMHTLGKAEDSAPVYYQVTYKYLDTNGNTVKASITESVLAGTTVTAASAPTITGYNFKSVSPTSVVVNSPTTITYTYEAKQDTVFYTVTYKYVTAEGSTVQANTTQRVAAGTTLNLLASTAPSIADYTIVSVSPQGVTTVNSDITVTYTYKAVAYYTITYRYVDSSGSDVSASTTERVVEGTVKNFSTGTAPAVSGYAVSSVSPSGTTTISGNITVTYVYAKIVTTWYVEAADKTVRNGVANPSYASFAYRNTATVAACIGKPINALGMYVNTAGVMSYGKVSTAGGYVKLGEITLANPSNTTKQVYRINEVTLTEGERLWVVASSDTGLFYYGKTDSSFSGGNFNVQISSSNLTGGVASVNENLSIDIGYVSEA